VHFPHPLFCKSSLAWLVLVAALAVVAPGVVHAEALLVVEADTGKVLQAENATYPWYPASVTKLMTAYVTLKAVKDGHITLDTLFTVSPVAASQSPSKMGFRPGIQVTVDNALKMMLVKSANDMAVVLAEGVGGSIDGFSAQMNEAAQRLGMTQSSYVNPNGLPADGQITSARDLAILARAIIRDLPEYEYFVHIPSIRYGRKVTQNFNKLIGRYPGADGFKTGFICASGYNLVASATRNGKRLIAVVLGAPSATARAEKQQGLGLAIDRIINSVRRIASGLRPEVLDEIGLAAAFEWQAREFQRRTGIRCNVNIVTRFVDPDKERSTALFRIFQELLTNVARHANATRVNVALNESEAALALTVEDNGRGIKENEIESPRSLGFLGLRERVLAFGGTIGIKGDQGKGTKVSVSIPVTAHQPVFHA